MFRPVKFVVVLSALWALCATSPATASITSYRQVVQAGASEADTSLRVLEQRVKDLSDAERKKLIELANKERRLEQDLARPEVQDNDEQFTDIAAQLLDVGLERIRILTGKHADFFVALRNQFNDGLGNASQAIQLFEDALGGYITDSAGYSEVWSQEFAEQCPDFRDEAKRAVFMGLLLADPINNHTDQLLAKFDSDLLDAIVFYRSKGAIPQGKEMREAIAALAHTGGLLNKLALILRSNSSKAANWKAGSECPVADRIDDVKR